MEEEPREQEIRLNPEMIVVRAGGAVESVNGQTGDVVLTTSDLENTSGYQTGSEVESAISSAVAVEQEGREQADATITASVTAVANDLATEVTNRQNADATIQTSVDALMQGLTTETSNRAAADTQLQSNITAVQNSVTAEATARANADTALQGQIDALTASSDVKDIVGTHAALENYDTSTLGNNDIIKVLQDETQGGATTYYRWNASTQSFSLIGEEGPYYTKSQTDTLLDGKQGTLTAGTNITISGSTISATDTTYSAGNGLDLTGTTFSADTAVLATKNDLLGKQNTLTAGANIQISANTISATDTTYTAGTGLDLTGTEFSIDSTVALKSELGLVTLSYGNSTWQDFISAYNANKIVYCRASSNSDPGAGSQTRMAFMAYINNPTTPTEVEFQYVRSVSNKTASQQMDQVFVYKLTSSGGGTWTVTTRNMTSTIAAGTNMTSSYANGTLTLESRLYDTTGQNTNGGVTQKLFTDTVGDIETALNIINNGGGA